MINFDWHQLGSECLLFWPFLWWTIDSNLYVRNSLLVFILFWPNKTHIAKIYIFLTFCVSYGSYNWQKYLWKYEKKIKVDYFSKITKHFRPQNQPKSQILFHKDSLPRDLQFKVHIFRGGHKILRNLHLTFVLSSANQK